MNQEELARLAELQKNHHRNAAEEEELTRLCVKLSQTEAEKADDPRTLFVDESTRPNLNDDGDFGAQQKAKSAAEVEAWVAKAWEKIEPIIESLLRELAERAVNDLLKK